MTNPPSIVWLRLDLRLADQPALNAACERRGPVYPVFIWSPDEEGDWPPGAASRYYLHQSLVALARDLEAKGSRLILRRGPAAETLLALCRETGAQAVFWNRRYEPAITERDTRVKAALITHRIDVQSFNSALLFEPWTIQTKTGTPYQVFTPYWKACLSTAEPATPLPAPNAIPSPKVWPSSLGLEQLGLEPSVDWAGGIRETWQFGEQGAQARLADFLENDLTDYARGRDVPALRTTSRLSPHLHFGEISPRQLWHAVQDAASGVGESGAAQKLLSEVGWREFSYHLLYHFPQVPSEALREPFRRFPWHQDAVQLRAWQRGKTGYPLVDAGMRELWHTGYMHNRVRMVVASFLTKHLLIPWQDGARWFWDTLVDADLANNTQGWQWTAGCGADAAPYFRIFNPVSQGEKFDSAGDYVRRWIPELAAMPQRFIHRPWEAPESIRRDAGVRLGENYPAPLVDHAQARERALAAYEAIKPR